MIDIDKFGKITKPILPTVYEDAFSYLEEVAYLRDGVIEVSTQSNENKENLNKKVSHEEMENTYKINKDGDFKGSWFGIKHPVASEPGIQGQVTKNMNDIESIQQGIASEVVSRRVRGQNSVDSPAGTFDFANFAGQGKTTGIPIGGVIHHYTDGKVIQIDNVGQGNVIVTMVNANNPVRRADKPDTFFGNGYYLQLMTNNPNTKEVYSHFVIDEKGNPFWNGVLPSGAKTNTTVLTNAKDDNSTPAFEYVVVNKHVRPYTFKNGGNLLFYMEDRSGVASLNTINDFLELRSTAINGGIRLVSNGNGTIDLIGLGRSKGINGDTRDILVREVGARTGYPTENLKTGMMVFDTTLNKPVWRNATNTGWVDANGASV